MNWTIIKNEKDYNKAIKRFEEIFDATPDSSDSDEFDLLALLINSYEEEHFHIDEGDPIEVIKMKMNYMGFRQEDLIP
jgi:HTH-type transcriptional regulator / antitoxin HigA